MDDSNVREDVSGREIRVMGLPEKQDFSARLFVKDYLPYMAAINGRAPMAVRRLTKHLPPISCLRSLSC
jgi:hypothetical protein